MAQYWAPKLRPLSKRNLEGDEGGDQGEKDEKVEGENEENQEDGSAESKGEIPTDPSQSENEIPATQPDPDTYPSPPADSRTSEFLHFAPLRTPKKGAGHEDGERLDSKLAWTLGGELLPTLGLSSPWAESLPSMKKNENDQDNDDLEIARLEAELAKTETLVSKFKLPIINKFCF